MKKKKFNIINFLWIIPLIIGIIVGILGINKIVEANKIFVPEMNEEGWFDASVAKNNAKFYGFALTFFGFGFLGIFLTLFCVFLPRAIKEKANLVNNAKNDIVNSNNNNINTKKEKHCKYCGSTIKANETQCSSCGSKEFVD